MICEGLVLRYSRPESRSQGAEGLQHGPNSGHMNLVRSLVPKHSRERAGGHKTPSSGVRGQSRMLACSEWTQGTEGELRREPGRDKHGHRAGLDGGLLWSCAAARELSREFSDVSNSKTGMANSATP